MQEKQKEEAIERMKLLELSKGCIRAFEKDNEVWLSKGLGILYELRNDEKEMIEKFQQKRKCLVYHIIHNIFEFGECYSLLYVSNDEEEWYMDRDDLEHNIAMVYVVNKDADHFSEFGTISFKSINGGLRRLH